MVLLWCMEGVHWPKKTHPQPSKLKYRSEWKDTWQRKLNFHPGSKEAQACSFFLQNDGTLLQGLWHWMCWQYINGRCSKRKQTRASQVDKSNWAKIMENKVLHLKLVREIRGVLLACVVQHHVKVAHIPPGYGAYLNLEKEMITITPIFNKKSNFRLTQDSLDKAYFNYQCDSFKINNALVYQIFSKITDLEAYVCVKQRKSMQDHWAVFFDICKQFLVLTIWPDRQLKQKEAANFSLWWWEKRWDWDKYFALHK